MPNVANNRYMFTRHDVTIQVAVPNPSLGQDVVELFGSVLPSIVIGVRLAINKAGENAALRRVGLADELVRGPTCQRASSSNWAVHTCTLASEPTVMIPVRVPTCARRTGTESTSMSSPLPSCGNYADMMVCNLCPPPRSGMRSEAVAKGLIRIMNGLNKMLKVFC